MKLNDQISAHDPRAVANYILDACDLGGIRDMSNMKLQKLLYFAHREHLGIFGAPLVKLGFEAWEHGPVSPIVYQSFKSCGSASIDTRATMIDLYSGHDVVVPYRLSVRQEGIMDSVLSRLARKTAGTLRAMTHRSGGPWDAVWNERLQGNSGTTMPDDLIQRDFKGDPEQRRVDG